jgi:DNA-binding CsgD family transcriptional regulator
MAGIMRAISLTSAATDTHHRDVLLEHAAAAGSVASLFGDASERLARLVAHDAALWIATDPTTGLPAAPTLARNVVHADPSRCVDFWQLEFLTDDVNLFRDLIRADTPAAGLRASTRDRPARSARYNVLLRPLGTGDELRAVLRAGGSPWAYLVLWRDEGRPAFDAREIELVAGLSRSLAEALRSQAQTPARAPIATAGQQPGLMLFAADNELLSTNDAARVWLDEMRADFALEGASGVRLPNVVVATLMRARALAQRREGGIARARLRSGTGQWLVFHASCLHEADGTLGHTALVIEPATASEIAPIIVQAYELTPREQQVTQLIAQGAGTAEIAARLYLSAHTVRDHVKAIFEKVGVSSRGELVAKLFAEHYAPVHVDPSNVEAIHAS